MAILAAILLGRIQSPNSEPTATSPPGDLQGTDLESLGHIDKRLLVEATSSGPVQLASDEAAGNLDSDSRIKNLWLRLDAGDFTREKDPVAYEQAQREVARWHLDRAIQGELYSRAARFTGLGSWKSIEEKLAHLEGSDPVRHQMLQHVVEKSLVASEMINETALANWDNGDLVEVWPKEGGSHDPKEWLLRRDLPRRPAHQFAVSTQVGDRNFRLHFNSSLHPQVDVVLHEIQVGLEAMKDD